MNMHIKNCNVFTEQEVQEIYEEPIVGGDRLNLMGSMNQQYDEQPAGVLETEELRVEDTQPND